MAILVITVNMQCCRCKEKIDKILNCLRCKHCIEKIEYEGEKVIVRGSFCAEELRTCIWRKAGCKIIVSIVIVEFQLRGQSADECKLLHGGYFEANNPKIYLLKRETVLNLLKFYSNYNSCNRNKIRGGQAYARSPPQALPPPLFIRVSKVYNSIEGVST
ncbi:hypothetical protein OsJ_14654 [Oryza sativa Japonica Group]|uniref:HMA domain-containing protein n=1 Tax=Oryza sativa subsp. japonica TaxID=39947 RepID=B9FEZ4_ORYSJ|nr:hypothetical protein OsJ_14654 [Oryza sativa Japonica Group]